MVSVKDPSSSAARTPPVAPKNRAETSPRPSFISTASSTTAHKESRAAESPLLYASRFCDSCIAFFFFETSWGKPLASVVYTCEATFPLPQSITAVTGGRRISSPLLPNVVGTQDVPNGMDIDQVHTKALVRQSATQKGSARCTA
eukprot:CAMPEP_0172608754 /NCGR_PEP_ID=MMETSP1068-20121228/28818_1 /TAXON_ID=35684 /ORGANISM="Pseudopedinella elastica, Strain CCMP716" /LENGTH=144 /DNA_ID=CAMNT_0013412099 /DNA_START=1006 /DNA_END=1436 /DNA_ORIENTATION=-